MIDPTRAALVEVALGIDDDDPGSLGPDLAIDDDAAPALADAILAQPAMAAIKAVVDAAVAWRDSGDTENDRGSIDDLCDAIDALLAEDPDV